MRSFEIPELVERQQQQGQSWSEFLRVESLSMGLYRLPAGAVDLQRPHTEDEVYYVLGGRARFVAGDETHEVRPGTVLFVERNQEHRFFDITEDLSLLVFFAPAEGSRAPAARNT